MISIVVVLNWNHTFITEKLKEMLRYWKTRKKYITRIKQNLESLSGLLLIPNKDEFYLLQSTRNNL
jgi:hypothetical protein